MGENGSLPQQPRENSTFVPLKEGDYGADALLTLFPGMRGIPLPAGSLLFHQGSHVRLLLWKGSHLPVTWPLPRHPFEKQPQHQPIALVRLPKVTEHHFFMDLKLVTGSEDFSSLRERSPSLRGRLGRGGRKGTSHGQAGHPGYGAWTSCRGVFTSTFLLCSRLGEK